MKLSWIKTHSYCGYRKYIGIRKDGGRQCFYLGADRTAAELKAMELQVQYRKLIQSGAKGWTEAALESSDRKDAPAGGNTLSLVAAPIAIEMAHARPVVPAEGLAICEGLWLHAALDQYIKAQENKTPHQITPAFVQGQHIRVRRIKDALPDRPLSAIGPDELSAGVAHFSARPVSQFTAERIAVVTAIDTIKAIRAAFDWFDLTGRWDAPKRFERIFRVNKRNLMTPKERDEERNEVETFTVEELTRIMEMAWTRWHRVFIATALNLAMTQNELSTLSRRHLLNLDTDHPVIERRRAKTDVFCRWSFVFPEVTEGLRWIISTHDYDSVFVTANGKPPVRFTNRGRADTVANWWARLVQRAGVRPLTFRYLRKTAANMVRQVADRDASEAMLSHSNEGMAKAYTNHDWDKLASALRDLHTRLLPVLTVRDARPFISRRPRRFGSTK